MYNGWFHDIYKILQDTIKHKKYLKNFDEIGFDNLSMDVCQTL